MRDYRVVFYDGDTIKVERSGVMAGSPQDAVDLVSDEARKAGAWVPTIQELGYDKSEARSFWVEVCEYLRGFDEDGVYEGYIVLCRMRGKLRGVWEIPVLLNPEDEDQEMLWEAGDPEELRKCISISLH